MTALVAASAAHDERPRLLEDVSRIVADAVDAARAEAETRGLNLALAAPAQAEARVRAQPVRQAIDNLLSNALKYAASRIEVSLTLSNERLTLCVRDDGPGIPYADRELVFEPFHRVRGSAPGAGLGLAIVREVARAHAGRALALPSERGAEIVLELSRA